MKVSVFIDHATHGDTTSVNLMYKLANFSKVHTPKASYHVDANQALYLVGGRKSIAEYCKKNPFRIMTPAGQRLIMQMNRGRPGLTSAAKADIGFYDDAELVKATNVYKNKTVTLICIKSGTGDADWLYLKSNHSPDLKEMMDFFDATLLDVKLAMEFGLGSGTTGLARRLAHNDANVAPRRNGVEFVPSGKY